MAYDMCGIAGYCGPARNFSDEKLQRMLHSIAHRGPDDCGSYCTVVPSMPDARLWLGSRRLAIQDLSQGGHQPMIDPPSGNAIAFNGEIYNFLDLRARLERAGHVFGSRCDTEVALRSWRVEGPKAVEDWRGMFGAAVWDRGREELWLLRDPWGIKPLYYHWDGEGVAFCSEVRGLLAAEVVPRKLSRRGMEDYLRFGSVQDPVTIIDGIYALLPGHALRWSRGRMEIQRLPAARAAEMSPLEVPSMLREIVEQQLIADVPVVVFLSGGVDSSVVALAARQAAGAEVHTMSVVFEEAAFSERQYARRVASHIGSQHHEVMLRAGDVQGKAVEAIARMDQPSVDGVNTYVVCEAAKRAGFTVALSGLGGDEFFGGYPTFRRAALVRRVQQWAQRAPGLAQAAGRTIGRGQLGRYLASGDFWEHPYFLQRTVFFPKQIERLCRGGIASSEADRMAEARFQSLVEEAEKLDPLNQISWLEGRMYMANTLLRDSDQMSMAHSLELRVPLVDHVLAARLLATPGERKGFGRIPKLWLRQTFNKSLPREVFARKKMGFTLPFAVWLKGSLGQELVRTLQSDREELWNSDAVAEVCNGFRRGQVAWSRPWALYVLKRWAAEHIHGKIERISSLESTT